MVLRFSRSAVDPNSYVLERQAPSGTWSRRMPLNPLFAFEFAQFEVPSDRIKDVQERLINLTPGYSWTEQF
jgi:hypothetical protein